MLDSHVRDEINDIARQLIQKYHPEKVIIFGSAAYGTFGQDSDLDLLIIKKGVDEVRRHERHLTVRMLLESDYSLDVLVYTPYEIKKRLFIGDPFIKKILSDGKILYGG